MTRRLHFVSFCLLFMTLTMGMNCKKDLGTPPKYFLTQSIGLYPAKKTYSVNDTIILSFKSNNKAYLDSASNRTIPTNDLRLAFGAALLKKYNAPTNTTDGFAKFLLPAGATSNYLNTASGTSDIFAIECDNNSSYDFQIGVVLKYAGIYILKLPDGITLQTCSGQGNDNLPATLLFKYNLSDCNKDVYLSIPLPDRLESPAGYTEALIDYKLAYAIKVE